MGSLGLVTQRKIPQQEGDRLCLILSKHTGMLLWFALVFRNRNDSSLLNNNKNSGYIAGGGKSEIRKQRCW
jgi:hypothetical protein